MRYDEHGWHDDFQVLFPLCEWHRTIMIMSHDDVIKWIHFPRYWPFVRGIHRSSVNSPHNGQWRGALMFSLICVWINGWVNNRKAGDLRRHRAHYDVIVMVNTDSGNGSGHRQHTIVWANVDPVKCRHMTSLCHSNFMVNYGYEYKRHYIEPSMSSDAYMRQ